MTNHSLKVEGLTKIFKTSDNPAPAVDDVTFSVERDQFITLLGPSGCGKTTTLRMIAGLELPTRGKILFDGEDFLAMSPKRRGIGMVFQSYALFPHMNVYENAAYGLRLRTHKASEIATKTNVILESLGLASYATRLSSPLFMYQ